MPGSSRRSFKRLRLRVGLRDGSILGDSASTSVVFAPGALSGGTFQPLVSLSNLTGKNLSGTWKLWVEDRGGVNRGTVDSFALIVTPKAG